MVRETVFGYSVKEKVDTQLILVSIREYRRVLDDKDFY